RDGALGHARSPLPQELPGHTDPRARCRIQIAVSHVFPAQPEKETNTMGMGASLLLVAAGAILIWAVNATGSGLELHTIGWILLAVGAAGALLSLIFWSILGGVGGRADGPRGRRTVVRHDHDAGL